MLANSNKPDFIYIDWRSEMLAALVPLLLNLGMTIEQIAEQSGVDLEAVRQAANRQM